jgi:hypothetical protein
LVLSPIQALRVHTTGKPSAAASRSLFFIPAPETIGRIATSESDTSSRRSSKFFFIVTPGNFPNAITESSGAKPHIVRQADGVLSMTNGQTYLQNQIIDWIFGGKSRRPQNTHERLDLLNSRGE